MFWPWVRQLLTLLLFQLNPFIALNPLEKLDFFKDQSPQKYALARQIFLDAVCNHYPYNFLKLNFWIQLKQYDNNVPSTRPATQPPPPDKYAEPGAAAAKILRLKRQRPAQQQGTTVESEMDQYLSEPYKECSILEYWEVSSVLFTGTMC